MFKVAAMILAAVLLFGCTSSIGQLVKNVYFDNDGNLVVEKCHISLNQGTDSLSADNCTTEKHKVPGR